MEYVVGQIGGASRSASPLLNFLELASRRQRRVASNRLSAIVCLDYKVIPKEDKKKKSRRAGE